MAQVNTRFQSLSKVIREVEEDICWLQRHAVDGVVPREIQRDLQDLQRTRINLLSQQDQLSTITA